MKPLSAALKAHYAQGTTTLATCWKATLTNGTVVAATSHDQNIVLAGVTYQSVAAYTPSDIASASDLSVDNLELEAFLASPHIMEADLHSGIWDYAAIEMFEVNYTNLSQGRNLLRKGTLGEVKGGQAKFTAELRGLMQAFTRRIVQITTKECTADLGDARCKVDLAPWTAPRYVRTNSAARGRVILRFLLRPDEGGRPELLVSGGKQYLLMGGQGGVVSPASQGQSADGHTVQIHVNVEPPAGSSRQTAMQWGASAGRAIQQHARRAAVSASWSRWPAAR